MFAPLRSLVALVVLSVLATLLVSALPAEQHSKRLLYGSSTTKVKGVNLGGWFIIEKWMKPSLFDSAAQMTGNSSAVDQWTFMQSFKNQSQASDLLKQHWSTWITESDFKAIKNLGLSKCSH